MFTYKVSGWVKIRPKTAYVIYEWYLSSGVGGGRWAWRLRSKKTSSEVCLAVGDSGCCGFHVCRTCLWKDCDVGMSAHKEWLSGQPELPPLLTPLWPLLILLLASTASTSVGGIGFENSVIRCSAWSPPWCGFPRVECSPNSSSQVVLMLLSFPLELMASC